MLNIKSFLNDNSGATAIEYGLIAALVLGGHHRRADDAGDQADLDVRCGVRQS